MATYIGNAFSLGMVSRDLLSSVRIAPCERPDYDGAISCIGHADTAAVLGLPMARISVVLQPGDALYVAQLRGGRLPEGCVQLPAGYAFDWVKIAIGFDCRA